MCNAWHLTPVLAAIGAVVSAVALMSFGGRFQDRIQTAHAATWQWLGTWKFRAIDSAPEEAALPEFIWSGMYRELNDAHLDGLAVRIKIATVLVIMSVGVLALADWQNPLTVVLACIRSD